MRNAFIDLGRLVAGEVVLAHDIISTQVRETFGPDPAKVRAVFFVLAVVDA